jgi:hypothetical protein
MARYRQQRFKPQGLFTHIDWETTEAIKKLAREMDISASSLVNAIVAKALANSRASADESGSDSSGSRDGAQ